MEIDNLKLNNYLQKIRGSVCPLCGTNEWTISSKIFQAIEYDPKGLLINGASYPMVPLTCTNCGNTYFINALVAGLIEQTNTIAAKEPPSQKDM